MIIKKLFLTIIFVLVVLVTLDVILKWQNMSAVKSDFIGNYYTKTGKLAFTINENFKVEFDGPFSVGGETKSGDFCTSPEDLEEHIVVICGYPNKRAREIRTFNFNKGMNSKIEICSETECYFNK